MSAPIEDLPGYRNQLSLRNKLGRVAWFWASLFLFRPTPRPLLGWRRALLRLFGARIGRGANVYASARIWAPWNLSMGVRACISENVTVYSVAPIEIGDGAVISQNVHLCAASHDYDDPAFPLISAPIRIGARAWVCADAFVGPGLTVGEGAVVGARSAVFKDVPAWTVVGGNPARFLKKRDPAGSASAPPGEGGGTCPAK
jgi:putative colanic acid biosynthesis acetyltransferase WcaF